MNKNISISCVLLASLAITTAFAEDNIPVAAPVVVAPTAVAPVAAPAVAPAPAAPVSNCAEWKSGVAIDTEELNKLQKNVASDKPDSGLLYTKKQFVVLLGKNWAKAKDTLANSKAKLPRTSEGKVDLKDVTLNGFNLSGLNFDNVDFKGAEMNGADLSGASLRGASLAKVELDGANLNNANLSFANLTKTKFISASLCHATLVSAELEDAVLRGASLKDAKLDNAKNIPPNIYPNAQAILQFGLPVPPNN
jgi:hypothetical protein